MCSALEKLKLKRKPGSAAGAKKAPSPPGGKKTPSPPGGKKASSPPGGKNAHSKKTPSPPSFTTVKPVPKWKAPVTAATGLHAKLAGTKRVAQMTVRELEATA